MGTRRTASVLLGLALTGAVFGAIAGMVTLWAFLAALGLRHGRLEPSLPPFAALLGALVGGPCGAVLAPLAAFTSWRYVPLGRLFAHLTAGTVAGGGGFAVVTGHPALALFGGLVGFLLAGVRVATRCAPAPVTPRDDLSSAGQLGVSRTKKI